MSELCVGLSKNTTLKKLWVAGINITDFSGVIFGTMLKYDQKLELLDLSDNKIGSDSVTQIFKGVITNTTLNSLYLNRCGLANRNLRVS